MGLMLLVSKEISLNDFILCMNFISASQLFLNLVRSVLKPQKINIIRDYISTLPFSFFAVVFILEMAFSSWRKEV